MPPIADAMVCCGSRGDQCVEAGGVRCIGAAPSRGNLRPPERKPSGVVEEIVESVSCLAPHKPNLDDGTTVPFVDDVTLGTNLGCSEPFVDQPALQHKRKPSVAVEEIVESVPCFAPHMPYLANGTMVSFVNDLTLDTSPHCSETVVDQPALQHFSN